LGVAPVFSAMMQEAEQSILLVLLLRVGFMAALAGLVVAFKPLRQVVTGERRDPLLRLGRVLLEITVLAVGAGARLKLLNPAADLSLEGTFLIGWSHGLAAGLLAGHVLGFVEAWGGHWAPIPFLILVGAFAGRLSGAFSDVSGWTKGTRAWDRKVAREAFYVIGIFIVMVLGWTIMSRFGKTPEVAPVTGYISLAGVVISSITAIVAPLWIWRGFRMEAELERRTRQMEKLRMESLMERFRPHFLFNTLSTIVSLMRIDVERARAMTLKLAGLLRRAMSSGEGFVPLKEELRFARDYLDIEAIRHGDRLKIVENVDPEALNLPVPRMLLQPLLENAVIHGIDPKVEGGTVTINVGKQGDYLKIEVADDGVGLTEPKREGIGLANLRDRLKVAYRDNSARLELNECSEEGGACATLWIPLERRA